MTSNSKKLVQPKGTLTQFKKIKVSRIREMSTASNLREIPLDLELGGKTFYLET
jgi:hypothetical protein